MNQDRDKWRAWNAEVAVRHRLYGLDCPAVDLDHLLIEYDHAKPVALFEQKHEDAPVLEALNASYQAIAELGTEARRPVFEARYAGDYSRWVVTPLNDFARTWISGMTYFTEIGYVRFLYWLRGRTVPQKVLDALSA